MSTVEELKAALIAGWPVDVERVVDFEDSPGLHVGALAAVIKDKLTDTVDTLAVEVNPVTCVQNLPRWERVFGITSPSSSLAKRRAAEISRFRELGSVVTKPMVQSVIAPLLAMADASQLVVIESDRAALRTAHTYSWAGTRSYSTTPASIRIHVPDDAAVSPAGAQLDLTLTGDLGKLSVTLTAPDSTAVSVGYGNVGRGSVTGGSVRLYFRNLAGAAVGGVFGGDWTAALQASSGSGSVTAAALFVEGTGRDSTKHDGLGAAVWYWGVMVEESKIGPNADLVAARSALQRIHYACRPVSLLRRSSGAGALAAGNFAAVPGDPGSIPNGALPGTG